MQAKAWRRWKLYHAKAQRQKRAIKKGHSSLLGMALSGWLSRTHKMRQVKALKKRLATQQQHRCESRSRGVAQSVISINQSSIINRQHLLSGLCDTVIADEKARSCKHTRWGGMWWLGCHRRSKLLSVRGVCWFAPRFDSHMTYMSTMHVLACLT